eukprot:jgi/Mesen1/9257/ME000006S09253
MCFIKMESTMWRSYTCVTLPTCSGRQESARKEERRNNARTARPLPTKILTVGKGRSQGASLLVKDYSDRLQRYCPFEEVQIRPNPKNSRHAPTPPVEKIHSGFPAYIFLDDAEVQRLTESQRVLKSISPQDWVVVLDERGRDLTSQQLASLVADAGDRGAASLVLCIGGPYGHGPPMMERANDKVRLSAMVLNHEIALLVLLEQLYRAWTILRGENYHH